MLFFQAILSIFSIIALANENLGGCRGASRLLEEVLKETARRQTEEATDAPVAKEENWAVGDGLLNMKVTEGKVTVEGLKEPLSIKADLNPTEIEFLKKQTLKNSDAFGRTYSKESNKIALDAAVNSAKLHAAFYGKETSPKDAARELEALVKRASKNNPYLKVEIKQAETNAEEMKSLQRFADALEGLNQLNQRGQLGPAIEEYRKEGEQKEGARILNQILGRPEAAPTLDEVFRETDRQEKARNPDAVAVTLKYDTNREATVKFERDRTGGIKVSAPGKVGYTPKSLKDMVDWLQGKGFDERSYDWRTYESLDSTPFP